MREKEIHRYLQEDDTSKQQSGAHEVEDSPK